MQTREIPKNDWEKFLDDFSRQYQGRKVTVEVRDPNGKSQTEARQVPLQGIATNLKHGDDDTISIIMASETDDIESHLVSNTDHIRVQKDDSGADNTLEIQSRDGSIAILRLNQVA